MIVRNKYPTYGSYREDVAPWLGQVPCEWKFERGKWHHAHRKTLNINRVSDNVLSLTLRGVVNNDPDNPEGLVPSDYSTYQLFEKDDLVFKLIDLENVRTSRVGLVHEDGIMSSAYVRIVPSVSTNPRFLYYFFYNLYLGEVYNRLGSGVRSTLGQKDLLDLPVPVISLACQESIVRFLDNKTAKLNQAISIKEQQIALLNERKQIIIQDAVSKGLNPNVPMKDSGIDWIGTIPAHWGLTELRYVGQFQNGISEGAEYFGEGFPFVTYGDVFNNITLPANPTGLAKATAADKNKYSVRRGDVFFTRTSEVADEIGISATCMETIEDATFSGFIIRMRPKLGGLNPDYSKFLFRSDYVREFFAMEMNMVTRASLGQELLKDLPLFIPPIEEQCELAAYLVIESKKIESAMALKRSQINALKEYKTSLINEAVTGKIKVA